MFKIGDEVEVVSIDTPGQKNYSVGQVGTISRMDGKLAVLNHEKHEGTGLFYRGFKPYTKGNIKMFGTIGSDLKVFIKDHKSTIYMLSVLLLADHLIFQGAFRVRLQNIMSSLLGKVEKAVGGVETSAPNVTLVADKKA